MSGRFVKRFVQLSLAFYLTGVSCSAVMAEPVTQGGVSLNELAILEHRYFSQAYTHDPAEKRLERLECLVYGSTREGSNPERLSRLMKTVATRSQQPIAQEKGATTVTPSGDKDAAGAKPPQTSKQYPVLNTLEWKALKKTFPNESLDQRLNRLESKMFGQPAESMAYADRVERLKKTVGIGINIEPNDGITATGPMPKARPRGEENGFDMMEGFNNSPPVAGVPEINNLMPNFGTMMPFGNIFGGTAFGGMEKQMQQMQQLLQQMQDPRNRQQLTPAPNGTIKSWSKSFTLDPETKQWVERNGVTPRGGGAPRLDDMQQESGQLKEVPGYADPNSI